MATDPFASPQATLESTPETVVQDRVYSPRQIGVATYLFSPLAGGVCMWLNLKDRPSERLPVAVGTVVVIILVIALSVFTPDEFPMRFINIGLAAGAYSWANKYDGGRFALLAVEGHQQSWWRLIGISLLCVLAYLLVIIPVLFAAEPELLGDLQALWAEGF